MINAMNKGNLTVELFKKKIIKYDFRTHENY